MTLEEILSKEPRAAATSFRHYPHLLEELKTLILPSVELSGCETAAELFYIYKMNIAEYPTCICGERLQYIKFNVGYKASCGKPQCREVIASRTREKTCMEKFGGKAPACNDAVKDKMKQTLVERYGTENIQQTEWVNEKKKKTNLERYGVEWSTQKKEIRDKTTKTMLERYGAGHAMNIEKFKEKSEQTNLKKYGYTNNLQSPETQKRIKTTIKERYGVEHPMQCEEIKIKTVETNLKKYGTPYPSQSDKIKEKISTTHINNFLKRMKENDKFIFKESLPNNRYVFISKVNGEEYVLTQTVFSRRFRNNEEIDTNINPLSQPKKQREISNFIKSIYDGLIIDDDQNILNGKHIDIYLPDLKIGFEFNGLYWHNELFRDKKYHLNKTIDCEKKDIQLFHIFEDEWKYKQEIVKSIIRNKLNKIDSVVYARKCSVKELDNVTGFLTDNHLQGDIPSKIKLGLFFDEQLVSVMTFGSERVALGKKKEEGCYEMLRFCNKINMNVVGGASKLFKFFIEKYQPKSVLSYADKRWFDGSLYKSLGFQYIHDSDPNYWYVIGDTRQHRFNFRKDKLVKEGYDKTKTEHQIMTDREIYRIYDCGNKKYLWKKHLNKFDPEMKMLNPKPKI